MSSSSASTFTFPPLFAFKPFFTPQPTDATSSQQRRVWIDLIRSYCTHYKITRIHVDEAATTGNTAAETAATASTSSRNNASAESRETKLIRALFSNSAIDRHLPASEIRHLLTMLAADSYGLWSDESTRTIFFISPEHRLSSVGDSIMAFLTRIGEESSILTLYELMHGDAYKQASWQGMDEKIVLSALRHLEAQGKCTVIASATGVVSETGVKFRG